MECKFWEEQGLLFTSGELDEKEKRVFEDHLHACDTCRDELQIYMTMKQSFFAPHTLEESPSEAVDKEILRVCSAPVRPAAVSTLFATYIKKAVYAALILAVGFAGGAYFIGLKVDTDLQRAEKAGIGNEQAPANIATGPGASRNVSADSADVDSSGQVIKRGDLQSQGVVPVDLKEE